MANVKDLLYHGVREQVRRVVLALGEERTDRGLTAFEDGHSNWSDCFFARALENDQVFRSEPNEYGVARALGFFRQDGGLNLVPVRMVYFAFDKMPGAVPKAEMKRLLADIRDETRPSEVMQLLRSINMEGFDENKPVEFVGACSNA
jgi:hypothetical protein